jgi:hypothetical protein
MTTAARILVHGGALIYNTSGSPYDRQLLFNDADRYARQHGSITLELDGEPWTVSAAQRRSPRCNGCGERVPSLSYAHQRRVLCPRCARILCFSDHHLHSLRAAARKPPRRKNGQPPQAGQQPPPVQRL